MMDPPPCHSKNDNGYMRKRGELVRINVCGMLYETFRSTLNRYPLTLLGDENRRKSFYVESKNAYFFDRNREAFEAVLHYYQSKGTISRPPSVSVVAFCKEICFFDLGEEVFLRLQEKEGCLPEKNELPKSYWHRKVWKLFEYPDSSSTARVLSLWSISVITCSVGIFCLETIPALYKWIYISGKRGTKHTPPWFLLELACIAWFSFEYLARLISSPNKCRFMFSYLNIIDLVAILPYFISLAIRKSVGSTRFSILRVVRLVRVFRVFKLSRYSLGLQILGKTIVASIQELGMLVMFLFFGVILFSSAIYYAEQGVNDMITSIPDAFWYSLVTMTTVGYGDKWPKTLLGKLVGSACAVCGVFTIALPVPVIVSNFEFYCKRDELSTLKYSKAKQMVDEVDLCTNPKRRAGVESKMRSMSVTRRKSIYRN